MKFIDIMDIFVKGLGVWIIMFGIAREILREGKARNPRLIPTLIRWAACATMFIAYGAIIAACPLIFWYGYWWAIPLPILFTPMIIFAFGAVCYWKKPFPKRAKNRTKSFPKTSKKRSSECPSGGVEDRWLDSP